MNLFGSSLAVVRYGMYVRRRWGLLWRYEIGHRTDSAPEGQQKALRVLTNINQIVRQHKEGENDRYGSKLEHLKSKPSSLLRSLALPSLLLFSVDFSIDPISITILWSDTRDFLCFFHRPYYPRVLDELSFGGRGRKFLGRKGLSIQT